MSGSALNQGSIAPLVAVGKTNLATGFTLEGGTTSKTLTVTGDATISETPPVHADLDVLMDNIVILGWQLAIHSGLTVFNLEDGVVDEFEDESGIDTTDSLNEVYDSSGDYYSPSFASPVVAASYTEDKKDGGDHMQVSAWSREGQAITLAACVITSVKVYLYKSSSPTGNMYINLKACTGSPGTTGVPTGSALATSEVKNMSSVGAWGLVEFNFTTPYSWAGGNLCLELQVEGGDGSNYIDIGYDGSSPTDAGNNFYYDGSYHAQAGQDTIYYVYAQSTANAMTLISESKEANTQPTKARFLALVEPVDTITLNTDLLAYISEDDQAHWDQVTLADEGYFDATKKIYAGNVNLTSYSDKTMRQKLVTANNKNLKVHAWAMMWGT